MKLKHTPIILPLILILLISTQGFTQKRSGTPYLLPQQDNPYLAKTPNDTLLPGNLANLATPEYVMIPADNGGHVLGTNGWNDKCKCEQFKVSYYYHIEGAIYWFGYKRADSSGLIRFVIWDMDSIKGTTYDTMIHTNQKCPGTMFVAITDTVKNVDTSSNQSQAHVVLFPFPVLVTSDYCIGFDMSNIGADSIALVSTNKGQGGNQQLVWEQWSSNNRWYTLQGAQWDSSTLDIDAMIFPIIDNTAGCVENGNFISGVKLSQSNPNPNPGACTISYEFATPQTSASFRIIDMQGRQVFYNEELDKSQGVHQLIIDVSKLANGTYFYVLSAGTTHLAKKMSISK
ncbi:MAG TPA: T9SS type A sorting domain-containing protein [Bacteroidales bacterium]|nr:T9SS type A sorting domain-containing protein [Bacteroidales bacterium]